MRTTALLLSLMVCFSCNTAEAEKLHGQVQKSDARERLRRPDEDSLKSSLKVVPLGCLSPSCAPDGTQGDVKRGQINADDFTLPLAVREAPRLAPYSSGTFTPVFGTRYGARARRDYGCWMSGWGNVRLAKPDLAPDWSVTTQIQPAWTTHQENVFARGFGTLPVTEQRTLDWDAWYQTVSAALYQKWAACAKPPGTAIVRVTVTREGAVSLQFLNDPSNNKFKESLFRAVKAIEGASCLTFPTGSARGAASFDASFSAGNDQKSGVSCIASGDREITRKR